jgi:hypothetical protein
MPMLPLAEAAQQLGLTTEALRKRINRGTIVGRKRRGQWYVELDTVPSGRPDVGGQTAGQAATDQEPHTAGHVGVDMAGQRPDSAPEPGHTSGNGAALQTMARAQELAALTEAITAPWRRRLEEQAEELGRVRERLAVAEARLAELETPAPIPTSATNGSAAPAQEPERRVSWWRRLLWGTAPA